MIRGIPDRGSGRHMVLGAMMNGSTSHCHCRPPSWALLRARQAICDIREASENVLKLSKGLWVVLLVFQWKTEVLLKGIPNASEWFWRPCGHCTRLQVSGEGGRGVAVCGSQWHLGQRHVWLQTIISNGSQNLRCPHRYATVWRDSLKTHPLGKESVEDHLLKGCWNLKPVLFALPSGLQLTSLNRGFYGSKYANWQNKMVFLTHVLRRKVLSECKTGNWALKNESNNKPLIAQWINF